MSDTYIFLSFFYIPSPLRSFPSRICFLNFFFWKCLSVGKIFSFVFALPPSPHPVVRFNSFVFAPALSRLPSIAKMSWLLFRSGDGGEGQFCSTTPTPFGGAFFLGTKVVALNAALSAERLSRAKGDLALCDGAKVAGKIQFLRKSPFAEWKENFYACQTVLDDCMVSLTNLEGVGEVLKQNDDRKSVSETVGSPFPHPPSLQFPALYQRFCE